MGGDGAFLAGEAAGLISPSSLEGIHSALESGEILSRVLEWDAKAPNRAYERQTAHLRCRLGLKNLKCPFMYQPALRRLVMESGIGSIFVRGNRD